LDNSAFNKKFLEKIDKSFKLNELSNRSSNQDIDNFSTLSQMDDFYNSLLDEMHEIVLADKSTDITNLLNERLNQLIKDEKYEEAAAIRDYMNSLGIKRKN
jgi:cysteinyl-tRNA synthetase